MSVRKNVFRYGNSVKITNPEIFLRCGYPWTKQYVKDTIINQQIKSELSHIVDKCLGRMPTTKTIPYDLFDLYTIPENKGMDKILDELAYLILRENRFGGKERKIYIEKKPELLGKFGIVMDRKVVKTGRYIPGGPSYDYWNCGYDYDLPVLAGEGTHVIHLINVEFRDNIIRKYEDCAFWIPKENIQKVTAAEYYDYDKQGLPTL